MLKQIIVAASCGICWPALAITNDELAARGCPIQEMRSPSIERKAGDFVVHLGLDITVRGSDPAVTTSYQSITRASAVVAKRGMVWLDPPDAGPGTSFKIKCLVPPQ